MIGVHDMSTTLFIETFGRLTPIPKRVTLEPQSPQGLDGNLWSVFRDRSAHMGWSASDTEGPSHLWNVEEAELTFRHEGSRIGFAQVSLDVNPATILIPDDPTIDDGPPPGTDPSAGDWVAASVPTLDDAGLPTDPAIAVSPLVQCLDDSLRWFGEIDVSAVQVTALYLHHDPERNQHHPSSVLGWFALSTGTRVSALLRLMTGTRPDHLASEAVEALQDINAGPFRFGQLLTTEQGEGIALSMPEWTPAAVGWAIAEAFDTALQLDSVPRDISVRVSRLT